MIPIALGFDVTPDDWLRARHELLTMRDRRGSLSYGDVWFIGPFARVVISQSPDRMAIYEGSLLVLGQGLAGWARHPFNEYQWPGESVYQTPDIRIRVDPTERAMLTVVSRHPITFATTMHALRASLESFLDAASTAYASHCPEMAEVRDVPWLCDPRGRSVQT